MDVKELKFEKVGDFYIASFVSKGQCIIQLQREKQSIVSVLCNLDGLRPVTVQTLQNPYTPNVIFDLNILAGVEVTIKSHTEVLVGKITYGEENGGGDMVNGYEFVDLGLSVKWATCNIGASKPEEYGWYFQWGGTIPYNSDRTPVDGGDAINFGWRDYPLCNGTYATIKKYCTQSSYGTVDNKTILEPEDDAAHVHLGGDCRMPTEAECNELLNACNITWVTDYNGTGINGCLFTLKTDSSKTLFFPASGNLVGSFKNGASSLGLYWSSSLDSSSSEMGRYLFLSSGNCNTSNGNRGYGQSVRSVLPKT